MASDASSTTTTLSTEGTNLQDEVEFIINDIGFAVNSISLSKTLPQSPYVVFLNIETKDKDCFTVRLTVQGFQVVSHETEKDENGSAKYPVAYETVYALLQNISPSYVDLFGKALTEKLEALKRLEDETGSAK